jgi:DNA-binding transcriptional regulator YiaG
MINLQKDASNAKLYQVRAAEKINCPEFATYYG